MNIKQKIDHISISQIMTYINCPEHYLFRYMLGIKSPPKKVLARGKSFHASYAKFFKGEVNKKGEVKDVYIENLKKGIEEYQKELEETSWLVDKEYLNREEEITEKELEKSGLDGIDVYHPIAQKIQPLEVEKEVRLKTNKGIDLLGYVDLITKNKEIYELKTTQKTPSNEEVEKDPQISFYNFLLKNANIETSQKIIKEFVIFLKTPKVRRYTVNSNNLRIKDETVLDYINNIIKAIENNIFYCIHPSNSWVCSSGWCGYAKLHKELREKGIEWILTKYSKSN